MVNAASRLRHRTSRALHLSLARFCDGRLMPATRHVVGLVIVILAFGCTFAVVVRSAGASGTAVADAQATLRFTDAMVVEFGYGPQRVLATDLNGDGNPDLASIDASTVSVLLGKGTGSFRKRASYRTARHAAGFTA